MTTILYRASWTWGEKVVCCSQVEGCTHSCDHPLHSCSRHICPMPCFLWTCDISPAVRPTLLTPGTGPKVFWGRNLPTAPLGFPEFPRPERTPGATWPGNWTQARFAVQWGNREKRNWCWLIPHMENDWWRCTAGFSDLSVTFESRCLEVLVGTSCVRKWVMVCYSHWRWVWRLGCVLTRWRSRWEGIPVL